MNMFQAILLFLMVAAPEPKTEEREKIKATITVDRDSVALSGEIALTLTVTGPAPIEVVKPKPLLVKTSANVWYVREVGKFTVEDLPKGVQRWKQEYILRPFEPGPEIEIALAPLQVRAGNALPTEITWRRESTININVTTSITRVNIDQLRPITDIEPVPAEVPKPSKERYELIAVIIGLGALVLIVAVRFGFRHRQPKSVSDYGVAWAQHELDTLSLLSYPRLAEVVRLFIQHRFDVPAERLTTAELMHSLERTPASLFVDELRSILEQCDIAKFASGAGASDAQDWERCIEKAKRLITTAKP